MGKRTRQQALTEDTSVDGAVPGRKQSERRGMFTSGIVSTNEGRRIALFFSGRQHAGRISPTCWPSVPPICCRRSRCVMALSRNLPAGLETILAHCLAHGRRQFVDVAERFPEECRYVLEMPAEVYKNDAIAREQNLSPEARLRFHQAHGALIMEGLWAWCNRQFEERLVEPDSGLGEAIATCPGTGTS
jgi:hypothetical protein